MNERSKLHVAFEIGVILKGLNGLLELIGGTLLLLFPPSAIQRFVVGLTHNELSRDPNDFIATHAADAQRMVDAGIAKVTGTGVGLPVIAAAWGSMTFTNDPIAPSLDGSAKHADGQPQGQSGKPEREHRARALRHASHLG